MRTQDWPNPNYNPPPMQPLPAQVDYWPSKQVARSAAWYMRHAQRSGWAPLEKGDQANIRRIDREEMRCDFNANPRLDPPQWERWEFTAAEIAKGKGGRKVT